MSFPSKSRREFLHQAMMLGTLPWLPSLFPSLAAAQAAMPARKKRFIALFTSNGQRQSQWFPSVDPSWRVRDASLAVRDAALSSIAWSPVLQPLQSFASKLTLLRGVGHVRPTGNDDAHVPQRFLGAANSPVNTVDQILRRSGSIYPDVWDSRRRSVHIAMRGWQDMGASISVSNSVQQPHSIDLNAVYNTLFSGFTAPSREAARNPLSRVERKHALMQRVKNHYSTAASDPRLGKEDRTRLEAHVALLRDIETGVVGSSSGGTGGGTAGTSGGQSGGQTTGQTAGQSTGQSTGSSTGAPPPSPGTGCVVPPVPTRTWEHQDTYWDRPAQLEPEMTGIARTALDIVAAAVRCDRSRVFTVMLCPGTDLRNIGPTVGNAAQGLPNGEHHEMSHLRGMTGDAYLARTRALGQYQRYYAEQVAYLLQQLDVVEEPDTGRTYLDNSIILWGNEYGVSDDHNTFSMPVLLAGSAGTGIAPGRYIDYRQMNRMISTAFGAPDASEEPWLGRRYNDVLVSILNGLGVLRSEYEVAGEAGFGDYSASYDATQGGQYRSSDQASRVVPLPFLSQA